MDQTFPSRQQLSLHQIRISKIISLVSVLVLHNYECYDFSRFHDVVPSSLTFRWSSCHRITSLSFSLIYFKVTMVRFTSKEYTQIFFHNSLRNGDFSCSVNLGVSVLPLVNLVFFVKFPILVEKSQFSSCKRSTTQRCAFVSDLAKFSASSSLYALMCSKEFS